MASWLRKIAIPLYRVLITTHLGYAVQFGTPRGDADECAWVPQTCSIQHCQGLEHFPREESQKELGMLSLEKRQLREHLRSPLAYGKDSKEMETGFSQLCMPGSWEAMTIYWKGRFWHKDKILHYDHDKTLDQVSQSHCAISTLGYFQDLNG